MAADDGVLVLEQFDGEIGGTLVLELPQQAFHGPGGGTSNILVLVVKGGKDHVPGLPERSLGDDLQGSPVGPDRFRGLQGPHEGFLDLLQEDPAVPSLVG